VSTQFFLGLFCLGFFLEEISWGQRIFGWETPGWMSKINIQNETNIHNICNKIFQTRHCENFLQKTLASGFSLIILLLAGLKNSIQQPALQGFFRVGKYYFLAILIAISTNIVSNEVSEVLLALFFLGYGNDVLKFYRNFQPQQEA